MVNCPHPVVVRSTVSHLSRHISSRHVCRLGSHFLSLYIAPALAHS